MDILLSKGEYTFWRLYSASIIFAHLFVFNLYEGFMFTVYKANVSH